MQQLQQKERGTGRARVRKGVRTGGLCDSATRRASQCRGGDLQGCRGTHAPRWEATTARLAPMAGMSRPEAKRAAGRKLLRVQQALDPPLTIQQRKVRRLLRQLLCGRLLRRRRLRRLLLRRLLGLFGLGQQLLLDRAHVGVQRLDCSGEDKGRGGNGAGWLRCRGVRRAARLAAFRAAHTPCKAWHMGAPTSGKRRAWPASQPRLTTLSRQLPVGAAAAAGMSVGPTRGMPCEHADALHLGRHTHTRHGL